MSSQMPMGFDDSNVIDPTKSTQGQAVADARTMSAQDMIDEIAAVTQKDAKNYVLDTLTEIDNTSVVPKELSNYKFTYALTLLYMTSAMDVIENTLMSVKYMKELAPIFTMIKLLVNGNDDSFLTAIDALNNSIDTFESKIDTPRKKLFARTLGQLEYNKLVQAARLKLADATIQQNKPEEQNTNQGFSQQMVQPTYESMDVTDKIKFMRKLRDEMQDAGKDLSGINDVIDYLKDLI